jgi:hypothetical protein
VVQTYSDLVYSSISLRAVAFCRLLVAAVSHLFDVSIAVDYGGALAECHRLPFRLITYICHDCGVCGLVCVVCDYPAALCVIVACAWY